MTTTDTTRAAVKAATAVEACQRAECDAPADGARHSYTDGATEQLCGPHLHEPSLLAERAVQGYWDALADGESYDDAVSEAFALDHNERLVAEAAEREQAEREAAWREHDAAGASAGEDAAEASL